MRCGPCQWQSVIHQEPSSGQVSATALYRAPISHGAAAQCGALLDPAQERDARPWAVHSQGVPYVFPFKFPAPSGLEALASVSNAGWGEVSVHAALFPTARGAEFVPCWNAGRLQAKRSRLAGWSVARAAVCRRPRTCSGAKETRSPSWLRPASSRTVSRFTASRSPRRDAKADPQRVCEMSNPTPAGRGAVAGRPHPRG